LEWTSDFPSSKLATMERTAKAIRCPQCGSLMRLSLAPGGKGLRSLRCEQCDQIDPLKAREIAGWLKGELQPPK
jgi:formate dehydrogenase maturation protein FdhE